MNNREEAIVSLQRAAPSRASVVRDARMLRSLDAMMEKRRLAAV